MKRITNVIERVVEFLTTDIWRISHLDISRSKSFWLKPTQILLLTFRGYVRDNCALRASALTFYSLLSIVPVAAMAFGIAKGFGLDTRLETLLYQHLAGQEAVVEKIIDFARSLLKNTQGGLIAGIGIAILFWSAIKVLGHIEATLNDIWKVKSRTFIRKFTDYLTIIILSPLLVVISSSVTVYVKSQVMFITDKVSVLELASPVIFFLLQLLPYGLIWLLFFLIYMVMPNTRVRISSALIAGIIAGSAFQFSQSLYIHAQVLLSRYNAIYGSFAALPFFLIWMQLSWMLVLLGAQIAYAHQHVGEYALIKSNENMSTSLQKRYGLQMLHLIVKRFEAGEPPPTAEAITKQLQLSYTTTIQILQRLMQGGLISMIRESEDEDSAYQPARDINRITIADLLEKWDSVGNNTLSLPASDEHRRAREALEAITSGLRTLKANRLVKDL